MTFPSAPEDTTFTKPLAKQAFKNPPHVLIIGAGSRGTAYAEAAQTCSNAVIVAICEPIASKRRAFGKKFIWGEEEPQPHQEFTDWKDWVAYETERRAKQSNDEGAIRGVDAVFVCVLDEFHESVILGIAPMKLHICCEKPLATSLQSCINIYQALKEHVEGGKEGEMERKGRIFGICHVLRYSPHNMLLRQLLLEKGVVGEILSLEHVEPVGWWHFSHSYVRGNWRSSRKTGPSLLTKSCHDIDFILWLLCSPPTSSVLSSVPTPTPPPPHLPATISSIGARNLFRKSRKPAAAGNATNCLSCPIEKECMYSAKKIYLEKHLEHDNTGWPVNIVDPEIEDIFKSKGTDAAKERLLADLAQDYTSETPAEEVQKRNWFGRCVWESDNDVCEDQFVTMTWEDDPLPKNTVSTAVDHRMAKTASLHMISSTEKQCERRGTIYGTTGEVSYNSTTITVYDHASGTSKTFTPHLAGGGHGGGDEGLVRQFLGAVDAVESGVMEVKEAQRGYLGCDLDEAFRSHAVLFAAEAARVERKEVRWGEWWRRVDGMLEEKEK